MSPRPLGARDLSPLPDDLSAEEIAWLRKLQDHLQLDEHVIRLGDTGQERDEIVSCSPDGRWFAGRYVGSIRFEGRQLEIRPRYSDQVVEGWLASVTNALITRGAARHEESSALVPRLLALLWCLELDRAARHGLPFLRAESAHVSLRIHGRLDLRGTARLGARRRQGVASLSNERSLDNAISETLVLGQRALKQMNGGEWWMTRRAEEVMPHLWEAVGTRPRAPRRRDLDRIRYTPIRRPFQPLVELSWQILRQGGYASTGTGESEGLLLDMAELWERFVLRSLSRAAPPGVEVIHGARETLGRREYLMRSASDPDVGLARMYPDIVVRREGRTIAVVDAKYKSLLPRPSARAGVVLGDAYQIAGYVTTLRESEETVGMLAYPYVPDDSGEPLAASDQPPAAVELADPWTLPKIGNPVRIRRLPVEPAECVAELGRLGLFPILRPSTAAPPARFTNRAFAA